MHTETQQLLLVDENDIFSGLYADRKACHAGKGRHHRAFIVLLFNDKREVLLQKRKHQLWDGYWDITATSHVLHTGKGDESYEEAAVRCLQAEMGIKGVALRNQGGFNYFARENDFCENEYCAVLTGVYNGTVTENKEAVYESAWVPFDTFLAERDDKKYTPWALLTSELLKDKKL